MSFPQQLSPWSVFLFLPFFFQLDRQTLKVILTGFVLRASVPGFLLGVLFGFLPVPLVDEMIALFLGDTSFFLDPGYADLSLFFRQPVFGLSPRSCVGLDAL